LNPDAGLSGDHRWLSLNTQRSASRAISFAIIEACGGRHPRIDPWRDQVAAVGLDRAVRAVRDAGWN